MEKTKLKCTYRHEPKESDLESITHLLGETCLFNEEELSIARELIDDRLVKGTGSEYSFLFADHHKDTLGFVCFGRIGGTEQRYEVYWIGVHPQFQNHGLGSELLRRVETLILEQGGQRCYIETSSRLEYAPTRHFYNTNGYRRCALLRDFFSTGDSKVIYVKVLKRCASHGGMIALTQRFLTLKS